MDREIILINGVLDYHAQWLGDQLASEQYSQLFVEHIPVKKIIRGMGRAGITAASNAELYDEICLSLNEYTNAGLVLISNYPQHANQLDDLYDLALHDGRHIAGLISPDAPKSDMIMEILSHHPDVLTAADAERLLALRHQKLDPLLLELRCREVPFQFIDMSESENDIVRNAVNYVKYLMTPDDFTEKHAS